VSSSPIEPNERPESPKSGHRAVEVTTMRHDSAVSVVEGRYLSDILDQPRALDETLRALAVSTALSAIARRLADGGFRRVVLTGMGSSHHGLAPLHLRLVEAGLASDMVESSELLHYQQRLLEDGTLLVLVSQSGRSAEILRLLEAVRGRAVTTLGVTNTEGSPLALQADAVLWTRAGEEATVSCKTYLASQAALAFLAVMLTGGDTDAAHAELAAAAGGVAPYLAGWRDHVSWLAERLRGVRAVYYAGRGPSLAAAGSAGLITKEATHLPAEGMSSAAFRHGPVEMLDEAVFLLVFAGEPRTRALHESLVRDVRAAGARAFLAAEDASEPALRLPPASSLARPVVELLPVEMITLALAALAGREAGRFERATKVTTNE
jgi:glucosamine--fructose-6-phosphate aminotransferase (isomerizing)